MVGAEGFEPPTLCSQSRCATRLRYAPTASLDCSAKEAVLRFPSEARSEMRVDPAGASASFPDTFAALAGNAGGATPQPVSRA